MNSCNFNQVKKIMAMNMHIKYSNINNKQYDNELAKLKFSFVKNILWFVCLLCYVLFTFHSFP